MNSAIAGVLIRPISIHQDPRGWLMEFFRTDELPHAFQIRMSYLSMTRPGVVRGPHEHREQSDYFCFAGPSDFELYLWDNRPSAGTFGRHERHLVGETSPAAVLVPPGVVHGYKNVGGRDGIVFNAPNRLYAGEGRTSPVDEIRWENNPDSPFRISAG